MRAHRITNRDPKTGRITTTFTNPTCLIWGCEKPTHARGWCGAHYQLWRKWGDPLVQRQRGVRREYLGLTDDERLLRRFVDRIAWGVECWPARGKGNRDGYQYFKIAGRSVLIHRWAYVYFIGAIPVGLTLDHLCRNTRCANPDHLEPVSLRENLRRGNGLAGHNARKFQCPRGHGYDLFYTNGKSPSGAVKYARRCSRCRVA